MLEIYAQLGACIGNEGAPERRVLQLGIVLNGPRLKEKMIFTLLPSL